MFINSASIPPLNFDFKREIRDDVEKYKCSKQMTKLP